MLLANFPDLTIRAAHSFDGEALANLCAELGYPLSAATVAERLEHFKGCQDRVVFVAALNAVVAGWIEVAAVYHLTSGPSGEIGGLVVSDTHRGKGIGRRLTAEAEGWLIARDIPRVIVRSRIQREDAHRFYLREGYQQIKTSAVLAKDLG